MSTSFQKKDWHEEAKRLYFDENVPAAQIAKKFNLPYGRVSFYLSKIGYKYGPVKVEPWHKLAFLAKKSGYYAAWTARHAKVSVAAVTYQTRTMPMPTKENIRAVMDHRKFIENDNYMNQGKPYKARAIKCSECGRVEVHTIYQNRLPIKFASYKFFKQKDWLVGYDMREDMCPDCFRAICRGEKTQNKTVGKKPPVKVTGELKMQNELAQNEFQFDAAQTEDVSDRHDEPVIPSPETEAGRQMTVSRATKRIVIMKLNEVYGSDGYNEGWNDSKVAKDLGVTREVVAMVRDESGLFGPDAKGGVTVKDVKEALERCSTLHRTAGNIAKDARFMSGLALAMTQEVEALAALLGKLIEARHKDVV